MIKQILFLVLLVILCKNEAAKILSYYPTPSLSHQIVFRPLTLELLKRGHEVTVLTTDPMFPNGGGPKNLIEIDLHNVSYEIQRKYKAKVKDVIDRYEYGKMVAVIIQLMKAQIFSEDVQMIVKDRSKTYDLIIIEAIMEGALGLKHIVKAPTIQFSSFAANIQHLYIYGAAIHPFIYPIALTEKLYNLTVWDKLNELHFASQFVALERDTKDLINRSMKEMFGADVPSFAELRSDTDMLFLNLHPVWDSNRPVPPNVIYLGGGLHQKPQEELPEDLQKYLDSSKNGVIYVSFGSNIDPSNFAAEKVKVFIKVFSKLSYDVLWKWNKDELPGRTANIKILKWLPQSDLLRHPKIKLFITQGGLQSTDEAITAGVPLIGMPILADQGSNVERYVRFGIGERVDFKSVSEDKLRSAINAVIGDEKYRKNVEKLRLIINDQPQTPLERAVWWTEYVIRHKGAKHLRSPAANMSLYEYYEVELLFLLLSPVFAIILLVVFATLLCCRNNKKSKKD